MKQSVLFINTGSALGQESRSEVASSMSSITSYNNDNDGQAGPGTDADKRELRVSVVIPAINEATNLPYVLPRIPTWVSEVLLVDGRSTDGTVEVARKLLPDIRIVTQRGRGKGDALRCGFEAAAGDIIVMLDADGS